MEGGKTLNRAFEEVEAAIAGADRDSVAVWPVTVTGIVGEFQVLTEKEWKRLLHVGIKLPSEVEVKEIYCFQNASSYHGLIARVLRVDGGSQVPQQEGMRLWKMQQTPVVIRRRMKMNVTKETRTKREDLCCSSATTQSPRPLVNAPMLNTISPEEVKNKRRRVGEGTSLYGDSISNANEVRPPMKTRRIIGKGGKKRVSVRISKTRNGDAESMDESEEYVEQLLTSDRLSRYNSVAMVSPAFVAVDRSSDSSDSLSAGEFEEDTSTSDNSGRELHSDADTRRVTAEQKTSAARQPKVKLSGECGSLLATLQQVISAGLGMESEDEDEGEDDFGASKSAFQIRIRVECAKRPASFSPFWSMIESASKRVHKVLSDFCEVSTVFTASTDQDANDYDLLWIEGEDQQQWTMFGEPRTPAKIDGKLKQHLRKSKHSGLNWRCW